MNYPHVTEIIRSNFGENPFWTSKDRDKGTALHKCINLIAQDKLNWNTVDSQIYNKVIAFQKFLAETGLWISRTFTEGLISKRYGFVGTPDALLLPSGNGVYTLVDWKSSIEKYVDFQLGGYLILLEEVLRIRPDIACAVELKDTGYYNIRWVEDLKRKKRQFLHLLAVHNIKKEYGYE